MLSKIISAVTSTCSVRWMGCASDWLRWIVQLQQQRVAVSHCMAEIAHHQTKMKSQVVARLFRQRPTHPCSLHPIISHHVYIWQSTL